MKTPDYVLGFGSRHLGPNQSFNIWSQAQSSFTPDRLIISGSREMVVLQTIYTKIKNDDLPQTLIFPTGDIPADVFRPGNDVTLDLPIIEEGSFVGISVTNTSTQVAFFSAALIGKVGSKT